MFALLRRHLLQPLAHLLELLRVEQLAAFERVLDRLLQIFERVLVHLGKLHVGIVEAALQEEIGQRAQQILGPMPRSSPVNFE